MNEKNRLWVILYFNWIPKQKKIIINWEKLSTDLDAVHLLFTKFKEFAEITIRLNIIYKLGNKIYGASDSVKAN